MFCPFCGFKFDNNYKFCPKCGKHQNLNSENSNLNKITEIDKFQNNLSDENFDVSGRTKSYIIDEIINIIIFITGFICFGIFMDKNISHYGVDKCINQLTGTFIFLTIIFTINFLYVSYFEIFHKATLGKMIFGINVIGFDFKSISLAQCFIRFITKPFVGLIYPIFLVWCLLGLRISDYGRRYGFSYNEQKIFNQNFWILIILLFLNLLFLILNYFYLINNNKSISDNFLKINVVKKIS
jgi:uncharacterized RDD family membrane protein YckC